MIMSDVLPPWITDAMLDVKRRAHRAGASEFSHGPGLTPPGLEDATEPKVAAITVVPRQSHATFGWARVR